MAKMWAGRFKKELNEDINEPLSYPFLIRNQSEVSLLGIFMMALCHGHVPIEHLSVTTYPPRYDRLPHSTDVRSAENIVELCILWNLFHRIEQSFHM